MHAHLPNKYVILGPNLHMKLHFSALFIDKLGDSFSFGTNLGPYINLFQLISPKYMPISLIKTYFSAKKLHHFSLGGAQ